MIVVPAMSLSFLITKTTVIHPYFLNIYAQVLQTWCSTCFTVIIKDKSKAERKDIVDELHRI